MTTTVRVEHPDGTTEDYTSFTRSEESYYWNKQSELLTEVPRDETKSFGVNPDEEEVILLVDGTKEFGGLVRDIKRTSETNVTLIVDSYERYAREAKPCANRLRYTNAKDTTIVSDAMADVSQLSTGTTDNIDSDLTYKFSAVTPARRVRQVREPTNAFIRYQPDKTLDFRDPSNIGSDKTNTTIGPGQGNIEEFNVEENSGQNRANKLVALGGGRERAQVRVEVTASQKSASERDIWATYSNRAIFDKDVLTAIAQKRVDEMYGGHLEVSCRARDITPVLGDTYNVKHSEEDIDANLDVVEKTVVRQGGAVFYDLVLSNRNLTRRSKAQQMAGDVERFNQQESITTEADMEGNIEFLEAGGDVILKVDSAASRGTDEHDSGFGWNDIQTNQDLDYVWSVDPQGQAGGGSAGALFRATRKISGTRVDKFWFGDQTGPRYEARQFELDADTDEFEILSQFQDEWAGYAYIFAQQTENGDTQSMAQARIEGTDHNTKIVDTDDTSQWGTSINSGDPINVYWSTTQAAYELQLDSTNAVRFRCHLFKN